MALLSGLGLSEVARSLHETGLSLHGGEYNVSDQAMAMESAATADEADDSYLTR
jgi:hypothetical protein